MRSEQLHSLPTVSQATRRTPEAPVFIMGDFSHYKLDFNLPGFSSMLKVTFAKSRRWTNVMGIYQGAYTAKIKPPIANSDHDTVHLIPTYRPVLKRSKPELKTVNVWSVDNVETLKGCFMCTDWEVSLRTIPTSTLLQIL